MSKEDLTENKNEEKASFTQQDWRKLNIKDLIIWIYNNQGLIELTTIEEIMERWIDEPEILKPLIENNLKKVDFKTLDSFLNLSNNEDKSDEDKLSKINYSIKITNDWAVYRGYDPEILWSISKLKNWLSNPNNDLSLTALKDIIAIHGKEKPEILESLIKDHLKNFDFETLEQTLFPLMEYEARNIGYSENLSLGSYQIQISTLHDTKGKNIKMKWLEYKGYTPKISSYEEIKTWISNNKNKIKIPVIREIIKVWDNYDIIKDLIDNNLRNFDLETLQELTSLLEIGERETYDINGIFDSWVKENIKEIDLESLQQILTLLDYNQRLRILNSWTQYKIEAKDANLKTLQEIIVLPKIEEDKKLKLLDSWLASNEKKIDLKALQELFLLLELDDVQRLKSLDCWFRVNIKEIDIKTLKEMFSLFDLDDNQRLEKLDAWSSNKLNGYNFDPIIKDFETFSKEILRLLDNEKQQDIVIINWLNSRYKQALITGLEQLFTFIVTDARKLKIISEFFHYNRNGIYECTKYDDREILELFNLIISINPPDLEDKIKIIKYLSLECEQEDVIKILHLLNNQDKASIINNYFNLGYRCEIYSFASAILKLNLLDGGFDAILNMLPKGDISENISKLLREVYLPKELEKSREIFNKFPILHYTLASVPSHTPDNIKLPEELQKAVDDRNEEAIINYYGIPTHQLTNIPNSINEHVSSLTILEMVKSGLINPDFLPSIRLQDKNELEKQQKALCDVINACFDLTKELGFEVINKNDPKTYPDFFKSLIRNTAKKGPASWIETGESLTKEGSLPVGIKDALNDYIKTIFLPHYLQGKQNYDIDEALEEFRPQAINQFFETISINGICKLSNRWHDPRKLAQLNKAKTFSDSMWKPLFSENSLNYKVKDKNIKIITLTTSEELTKEGKDLDHCVGSYTKECLLESSHIVSLRNESGESLSTIELELEKGQGNANDKQIINIEGEKDYYLKVRQHYGRSNKTPIFECLTAEKLFFDDLRSGKIKVDLPGLETERVKRDKIYKDPSKRALMIIGYDHNDQTKDENGETPLEKATRLYREHGLDNGEKKSKPKDDDKRPEAPLGQEQKTEPKLKDINVPKQLTRNFDRLTGKVKKQEEATERKEESKASGAPLTKIDKKPLMAIKDHIVEILEDQIKLPKRNINVTSSSENDKVYINILVPLPEASLNYLKNILGDKAMEANEGNKSKNVHTALIIRSEDLSNIIEVLQRKSPLKAKSKGKTVNIVMASKLEDPEEKEREH